MLKFRGFWFRLLIVQLLCVVGAFALRTNYPNLSAACWVVFGLLWVYKYFVMFRGDRGASTPVDQNEPR